MQIQTDCIESDVPFFPFPIQPSEDDSHYLVTNHHMDRPIRLNRQAVEVLRLADGEAPLSDIVSKLAIRYPDAGGSDAIRSPITDLLRLLTTKELVWWRKVPLEPVPIGPPPSVFWEITAACNLRCLHCVVGAGAKLGGELTIERCLGLAEELAEFGVQNVVFSGGEPLIHPDFRLIAQRVRNLGMTLQVATNGTLVTPEIACWLKDIGAEVQVSLDGSTPEIHGYMRPGREAYARAVEGIRVLVAAGHDITIGTVLSTVNLEDIPSIVALAEALGVARFRIIPFVPKGRGEYYTNMEVTPLEAKRISQYLHDLKGKTKLDIASLEFEDMLDNRPCTDPLDLTRSLGCSGAVGYATITPTGEILPCHFFEGVRADSVASTSFKEVWRRSRFLNYFRHLTVADLHGTCRSCSWLPRCGGSCRAVNFAKGDLLGTNAWCWIAQEMEGKAKDER
jgi:radical SAM protein with 4Fe4S-binding SPASM domain